MRELLNDIQGPTRYLGIESGSVHKNPSKVKARAALAFPDLYEVGMSYLGQKILYRAVNKHEHLWAERVFTPTLDTAKALREAGLPLTTLESDTPLADLDVIAFSVTHELCYTNVLFMLDLAGLPLETAERGDALPLIMAGGGCAFNAEPLAPFVDIMVLGDGEEVLPEVMDAVADAKARGLDKDAMLMELSRITGVYVPCFYETDEDGVPQPTRPGIGTVEKRILPDLDLADYPEDQPVALGDAVHDRLSMEIARGCTRGCRFCHAGMIYRPVRERSLENLKGIIERSLKNTGYEEMSFLSLSTGDYSALEALFAQEVPRCKQEQVAVALPSLRVGSVSGKIMKIMSGLRRTGATLAPEAGSQRLRDVINKGVAEEDLLTHARTLFANGWTHVKLYFMIGLPTETKEDLEAIFDLCMKTRMQGPKGRAQVTAAISPFVPKPHTPFQWERQINLEEIRERVDFLRDLFKRAKGMKLRWHAPEMSLLEGVFSRADRSLAPVVREAYERGALFSSWHDHLDLDTWLEVLAHHGMTAEQWLAERDEDTPLPWDHLLSGVSKTFLKRERRRALAEKLTTDCRYNGCKACGVCTHTAAPTELASQADLDIRPRLVLDHRDQSPEEPGEPVTFPSGRPERPDLGERLDKVQHLRIWHTKLKQAAFISQLELQRALERAMRRAELPLTFTGGYHPMPRMSFGKALPVGVSSASEWFNVYLRERVDLIRVAKDLSGHMPRGMRVTRIEELDHAKRQPQAVFEDFLIRYAGDVNNPEALWDEALSRESIIAVRESKTKGKREIEVRPVLHSFKALGPGVVKARFDWREKYVSPFLAVKAVSAGTARPDIVKLKQWMEEPGKAL